MPDELIAEFERGPKNAPKAQVLRVSIREFEGRRYADVRTHFRQRDGSYKPTGKGIGLRLQEIAEVSGALDRALTRLCEMEAAK